MREIKAIEIAKAVTELVKRANFSLCRDVWFALRKAYRCEKNRRARTILKAILDNAAYAKKENFDKAIEVGKKINVQGENFEVIGILKKGSSFQINDVVFMLNSDFERILGIKDEIDLMAKINYTFENPVRKGIVKTATEYEFSSARSYLLNEKDYITDIYQL